MVFLLVVKNVVIMLKRKLMTKKMKLSIINILILLSLCGCGERFKLHPDNLNEVLVIKNPVGNEKPDTLVIKDKKKIKKIISSINKNTQQPLKFMPNYRLEFYYMSDTVVLLVQGKCLNVKGRTYYMLNDLSKRLTEMY